MQIEFKEICFNLLWRNLGGISLIDQDIFALFIESLHLFPHLEPHNNSSWKKSSA